MIEAIGSVTAMPIATPEQKTTARVAEDFKQALTDALKRVNSDQIEAQELHKQLAAGQVDRLHDVMIAAEKASLGLQFTMQVRNKVVEAYQEVMRMQI